MSTLALCNKSKTYSRKEILLTLKKPADKIGGARIADRKVIEIRNSRDGRTIYLKEMQNLNKLDTGDRLGPKVVKITARNRTCLLNTKQYSIFKSALVKKNKKNQPKLGETCSRVLNKCQRTDSFKKETTETVSADLRGQNTGSNLNVKDRRFVPNILRSTKTGENSVDNNFNNLIGFDSVHVRLSSQRPENCSKDNRIVKRKRKQVLSPLDIKQVLSPLNMKHNYTQKRRIAHKKNKPTQSPPCVVNNNLAEESDGGIFGITAENVEPEGGDGCLGTEGKSVAAEEETVMDYCNQDNLCIADFDLSYLADTLPSEKTGIDYTDKSIKEIFDEFQVADYQNYIASEDLGFDIDAMDKLLCSDIDGCIAESSIYHKSTKMVELDVNGNNINNDGNPLQKRNDRYDQKSSDTLYNIERCYGDGRESRKKISGRLKRDRKFDSLCSQAFDYGTSYNTPSINLWSDDFQDYGYSHDLHDLNYSLERSLSSTDSASESESKDVNSTHSLNLILPKNETLDCSLTPLAVSDVVPDNVFSDDPNESFSESLESNDNTARRLSDSVVTMQQCFINSEDGNENIHYTSVEPLGRFTNDLQLFNSFDATFEHFEDYNFLLDDMLSIRCAVSNEDETCQSILADSNIQFDDNHVLNMYSDIPEFDMEDADDIAISKVLRLRNTIVDDFQPASEPQPENASSIEMECRYNESNIIVSSHKDSQFDTMNSDNPAHAEAERIVDESNSSNAITDGNLSLESEIETQVIACFACTTDFDQFYSMSESNELLAPWQDEINDTDDTGGASSQWSPPPQTSKLKHLLTGIESSVDYPSAYYRSEISHDVGTDLSLDKNMQDSESRGNCSAEYHAGVFKVSEVNDFDCTISSDKSYYDQEAGCEYIGDASCTYVAYYREKDKASPNMVTNSDDDHGFAEGGTYGEKDLLDFESSCRRDSFSCQSTCVLVDERYHKFKLFWLFEKINSYPVPCENESAVSTGKIVDEFKKRQRGLRQGLHESCKYQAENIGYIPCPYCTQKCRSNSDLDDHVQGIHRCRTPWINYKNKKYVCDKCSKEYSLAGAIEKHFKLHENYSLTCRICEKHFSEKIFLQRHVHSYHFGWNIQCDYCSRKFPRKNVLTRHLKQYHGIVYC